MVTNEQLQKARELSRQFADFISTLPFSCAEDIVADLYDHINTFRDVRITRANHTIDKIMELPEYPNDKWIQAIMDIKLAIVKLQGGSSNA